MLSFGDRCVFWDGYVREENPGLLEKKTRPINWVAHKCVCLGGRRVYSASHPPPPPPSPPLSLRGHCQNHNCHECGRHRYHPKQCMEKLWESKTTIMVESSWDDADWIWHYELTAIVINIVGSYDSPPPPNQCWCELVADTYCVQLIFQHWFGGGGKLVSSQHFWPWLKIAPSSSSPCLCNSTGKFSHGVLPEKVATTHWTSGRYLSGHRSEEARNELHSAGRRSDPRASWETRSLCWSSVCRRCPMCRSLARGPVDESMLGR